MRVNCHAHIFNLASVLSKATLDIVRSRIVAAVAGDDVTDGKLRARLAKKVGDAVAQQLANPPQLDEEAFVRDLLDDTGLLRELQQGTSGLPEPLGGLLADQLEKQAMLGLRSLIARLTGLLRRKKSIRKATLGDKVDLLLIAFQSELEAVADRLLDQLDPDDAAVSLFIDIAVAKGTIAERKADQALFVRHREDTVAAVMGHPGRLFPFIGVHPGRKGSPSDPELLSYLELAVDALENWGFVGVKLYPALGYNPDSADLDPVYDYCQEHAVPIMTHTSAGGFFANEEARKFSDPKLFGPVLARFPDLKICLAHFGGSSGVQRLHLVKSQRETNFGDTILNLMDDHPGVFTDVSFHEDPMKSEEAEDAYFDKLKELLGDPRYRDRILFGTDYWLIRTRVTEAGYWRFFEDLLSKQEFRRIAERNPVRYLGLPNAAGAGASEPMSNHIDFLIDNLAVIEAHRGRPSAWLLAAVESRSPEAFAALEALRKAQQPSPRLLIKAWDQALEQLIDRTLATDVTRLNPEGGWPIAGANFRLGGLGLAIEVTTNAAVGVELYNHNHSKDPDGVLENVLGVKKTGEMPSFEKQSWLKYSLSGSLRVAGQTSFEPQAFGLGFEAGKGIVLSDYRRHRRSDPSTRAAVVADLRRPRFAFSRSDVLSLGLDDAVSLRVTGTLSASVGLSWASVLAGNLNRLGNELGIDAPLDIQVGLSASVTAGLEVTDDFRVVFARPRRNPAGKPFRVEIRKVKSRGKNVGVRLGAGVRFANPAVVEQALAQMLGENLQAVDRMLAKAVSQLTPAEQKLRNRLVEKLGLTTKALAAIKAKRDQLEEKARATIKAIAEAEATIGFSFEYGQLEENSVLLQADLSPGALSELHSDLVRGHLSVLLERAGDEPDEMELLEYLRENRFVRQKSWGFFFGFLGGAGSARSFERSEIFEQVRSDGHKRQTYTGLRGYEVKGKKKDTWSGWRYSGELAAAMPGFERSPSTRDYKYALELCFEWHKPLSEKLREEVADAAVLWQAVNDPAVVLGALEPLGTKSPKIELRLRVRHAALVQLLPFAGALHAELTALALAAAMPYVKRGKKDPVRRSVAMRRAVYFGLWKSYLDDARVNRAPFQYAERARKHFRDNGPFDGVEVQSAAPLEIVASKFPYTFAGAVDLNPDLFLDLKKVHKGLSALAKAVEPVGLVPVEGEDPESLKLLFNDLNEGWGGCLQIRTFGRYLIEAANRVVGVPALVESSLAIEHGGVVRLVGGPLGAR